MCNRTNAAVLFATALTFAGGRSAYAAPPVLQTITADLTDSITAFEVVPLLLPAEGGASFTVSVPFEDRLFQLQLFSYTMRSENFQLLVDSGDGSLVPHQPDAPRTYRGSIVGLPGSEVRASLLDGQLSALIAPQPHELIYVQPAHEVMGDEALPGAHVVYRGEDTRIEGWCGVEGGENVVQDHGGGFGSQGGTLDVCEIAMDTDLEFYISNSSNVLLTMIDIESVMNLTEFIYERDVDITYEITAIVVRTGADPYTTSDAGGLLCEFRSAWNSAPEFSIQRDVSHLWTGRNLVGTTIGIAYLGTLCNLSGNPGCGGFGNLAYGLSQKPGITFNGRAGLVAHEVGHNWNAPHCNGNGDCHIMCSGLGGCNGLGLPNFGFSAVSFISNFANSASCLDVSVPPLTIPFFDDVPTGTLDPTKWTFINGASASSGGVAEPSEPRSIGLDSTGSGQYLDDEIRSNFIDLTGLDNLGVNVSYYTQHLNVEAGEELVVEFFSSNLLWEELNRVTSDGVSQTEFTFHINNLTGINDAFWSEFRIRFRVEVNSTLDDWFVDDIFVGTVPAPINDDCLDATPIGDGTFAFTTLGATTDGIVANCEGGAGSEFDNDVWFLYTASCTGDATFSVCNDADFDSRIAIYPDGACPQVTPQACNDNAPGCGVTSEVTTLVFADSQYQVRIGTSDLTPGSGNLTVSCASLLPCPSDLDDDGSTGITDLLALLAVWGACPGCPEDLDGDDVVGITDLLDLLAAWGPCP